MTYVPGSGLLHELRGVEFPSLALLSAIGRFTRGSRLHIGIVGAC